MLRRRVIPFMIRKRVYIAIGIPVFILCWLTVMAFPATEADMRKSVCGVSGTTTLCLVSGSDTVPLAVVPVSLQGVWINRHWWWPSCDGRVLTVLQMPWEGMTRLHPDTLANAQKDSLSTQVHRATIVRKELEYYLRCHNVQDEGYNRIAAYAERQRKEQDSLVALSKKTAKLLARKRKMHLLCLSNYRVTWYDGNGKCRMRNCRPLVSSIGSLDSPIIIHTYSSMIPWGCRAVKNVPWGVAHHKHVITVTLCPDNNRRKDHTILARGAYNHGKRLEVAYAFALPGTAVFTTHGRFIGLVKSERSL